MALRRRGTDMIIKAQGADITEQLSNVWGSGVEAMLQSAAQNPVQTREPATPQEIRKGLHPNTRGSRNQNEALKLRLETERVFTRQSLLQEIGNLDAGKPLSNEMKEIIRRSGLRPSEALLNQMRMHGIEVRPEEQQNLQKLDGSNLVSQARPAAQPNRFLGLATNLSNQLATGLVNTLVPPAQARGTAPSSGSPAVATRSTGGRSANTQWNQIVNMAKAAGAKFPELVAAQWALESAWGKSPSGRNNFFGQKGKGTSKATWEVVNGREVNTTASFMDFKSPQDSVNYLVQKWYQGKGGANKARTAEEAARILKQQGYATDPNYVIKLMRIIASQR